MADLKRGALSRQAARFFRALSVAHPIGNVKSTGDIRRANLELLLKEFKTLAALADAADTSSVYLTQIRTSAIDAKTKRPREMGSAMARRLERACTPPKPTGWMDVPHNDEFPQHVLRVARMLVLMDPEDFSKVRHFAEVSTGFDGPPGPLDAPAPLDTPTVQPIQGRRKHAAPAPQKLPRQRGA